MHIKLIGGPGNGVLLKVELKSRHWVWQHNGRNYFYALVGALADVGPDMGCAEKPVPLFAEGMTAMEIEMAMSTVV